MRLLAYNYGVTTYKPQFFAFVTFSFGNLRGHHADISNKIFHQH